MKRKLVVVFLTSAMLAIMSACGSKEETNVEKVEQSLENETKQSASDSEENANPEYFYGKITNVVGNEIEIALAKMPEVEETEIGEGGQESGDTAVAMVEATAAMSADQAQEGVESNIELSGETITITIPAGVSIRNLGVESNLTALKKGKLISVCVDNLETKKVQSIDIME